MESISVVISAWNEEKNLKRCLASVAWADQVIVVDNQSTDRTADIARNMKATVLRRENNPMLNVNKNFGFTQATGNWILSLDADEEVTAALVKEIKDVLRGSDMEGYWIPRKNIIFGKWIEHGLWWPDKQLRLFRKGSGKFPEKHVHEYLQVNGRTGELHEPYLHYNYQTISQFIRKMDSIYTDSEVKRLIESDYKFDWYDAIRFPVSDFVKIYFAQSGYKDGLHGLVLSILQSFYSFIVFAKLWEHHKFEVRDVSVSLISDELMKSKKEIEYWVLTAKLAEAKSSAEKVLLKIIRRLTYSNGLH